MDHILVQVMSEMTTLSEQESIDIAKSFPLITLQKGTYVLKEGQISNEYFFIVKGCIRAYALVDGEEKTTSFFTEHMTAIDFYSAANKVPTKLNFICTEETTVTCMSEEKEKILFSKHPRFESFCRIEMEKMLGNQQEQLAEYMLLDPEQRYYKLREERPDLLNRVPQYHIASYLGIRPETLSRIRAKSQS